MGSITYVSIPCLARTPRAFPSRTASLPLSQNVVDALTLAIGMGKVGGGMEPVIVKDAHVGVPALFQKTVLGNAHGLGGVIGEVFHRIFQRPQAEVTNQFQTADGGCGASGMAAAGLFIVHLAVGVVRPVGTQEHFWDGP